jgi:hypothetical protein
MSRQIAASVAIRISTPLLRRSLFFPQFLCLLAIAACAEAQSYRVVLVPNGGQISGLVKWTGSKPRDLEMVVNKDNQVCDPENHKYVNLERLIIGPDGGVANTVVFLKEISSGKSWNLPAVRRTLDQRHCRYEPHILLVPQNQTLTMRTSDPVLHTVHMDGASTLNLPFPIVNQSISREMQTSGLVNLHCNGGHAWMNAEMMVVPHPYYAVTDETGRFELDDVPPGHYEVIAWHEGWHELRRETALDVFTQKPVPRAIFREPRTWEQSTEVMPHATSSADFTISDK